MKKIILITYLIMFSSSLLAKDVICDWINPVYKDHLNAVSSQINYAFHFVVDRNSGE